MKALFEDRMRIIEADLLNSQAEALLLTIDGAARGMEGNLVRVYARRFPEDWHYIERELRFPIPLTRCVHVEWDGDAPWQHYLFASTLHHTEVYTDSEKLGIIQTAFANALNLCQRLQIRSLATAVLVGGWRNDAAQALQAMQQSWTYHPISRTAFDCQVHVLDTAALQSVSSTGD